MSDLAFYGDTWAPIYDEMHAHLDPTAAVEVLAALAGSGRALELGIGTGRVAIPLADRGVDVRGIEVSEAMLHRMRAKPGGAGDFTDVAVDGEYSLIYVVFSTLYGLLAQDAQVACVRNAAARLASGGVFVVEGFVPDPARFERDQRVQVTQIEATRGSTCCSLGTIRSVSASRASTLSPGRRGCSCIPSRFATSGPASST